MRRLRILVLGDGPMAALLALTLTDAGHEVIGPMTSGEEAIKLAHENKPQFAFLDINKHGSDSGHSIFHCFDELGIPTMFLIGSLGSNDQREAAAGVLSDPQYLDFLLTVVEYIRSKGRSMLPESPSCFLPEIVLCGAGIFVEALGLQPLSLFVGWNNF